MASYSGISGNPSKRVKMETLAPTTSVILIKDEEFEIIFERKEPEDSNSKVKQKGNKGITSGEEAPYIKVMSIDSLTAQVETVGTFEMYLRSMLRKAMGSHSEYKCDTIDLSWKITFVSDTCATVELLVGGEFFEEFLGACQEPVKVKVGLAIVLEDKSLFSINSKEMSPCVSIRKSSTTNRQTLAFEDKLKVEVKKPIRTDLAYRGTVTIEMLVIRKVVISDLPCGTGILGQRILENKVESDFSIIADDGTRLECNKVFLAASSEALAAMLQMDCKESREKVIKLNMSAKGVEALLKFIYYSNLDDPMKSSSIAFELLEIGHQYEILGLENAMRNILLGQKCEWFEIDAVVLLYLWTLKVDGNEDLKWKALLAFKLKPDELNSSRVFYKLLKEDPNAAKDLFAICLKTLSCYWT
ncbi:BTB/POZ domain-containing protein 8 [Orchesella cincta]|uniref:BTB/POZ domain-containing protein 8 n=1 Tax=Orchesella cincta TaxID=48709 RepID=A0A1D2M9H9_ORCCI|nr:BTB/POZ domain-containing protein 8 [Orchesella cincta]